MREMDYATKSESCVEIWDLPEKGVEGFFEEEKGRFILGDPGAVSRVAGIVVGESLL